jgi:hypothetical protein
MAKKKSRKRKSGRKSEEIVTEQTERGTEARCREDRAGNAE